MTYFGAMKIVQNNDERNFQTTFKIQGQVHHGSLLPIPNEAPKFLLINFMGDGDQVNMRCHYNHIKTMQEEIIVESLETFLGKRNNLLIQLFKQASTRMSNNNYTVVIKADKVPVGEHARRFNAPFNQRNIHCNGW